MVYNIYVVLTSKLNKQSKRDSIQDFSFVLGCFWVVLGGYLLIYIVSVIIEYTNLLLPFIIFRGDSRVPPASNPGNIRYYSDCQ